MNLQGWKGLSPYQSVCFAKVWCESGRHRFDGANFPTPEGLCPRCNWVEADRQIAQFQRLQMSAPSSYSPVGLNIQSPPPTLVGNEGDQISEQAQL